MCMSAREVFVQFLFDRWRDRSRWSTSTFKLGKEDDTWLALSEERECLVPVHTWSDPKHKWLHLVRIHNMTSVYPKGVMYPKNASLEEQKTLIRLLVAKVPEKDIPVKNKIIF